MSRRTPHRTQKDVKKMSQFERCVAEGNEKADELAKENAMLDEGFHGGNESKDSPARSEKEMYAALQHARQISLFGGRMERL